MKTYILRDPKTVELQNPRGLAALATADAPTGRRNRPGGDEPTRSQPVLRRERRRRPANGATGTKKKTAKESRELQATATGLPSVARRAKEGGFNNG